MVKNSYSSIKKPANKVRRIVALIAIVCSILYFGLPPFLELDEEGNYTLSKKRKQELKEKSKNAERVEVYQLVTNKKGLYPCIKCIEIKMLRMEKGEIWKYGISRNRAKRYTKKFYKINKVQYQAIINTDLLNAERIEKELIISYPLLPEAQFRMKTYGIFLKRPPGNTKDQ